MAGIVSRPSCCIALTRVWPLMITFSRLMMIAPTNPNSLIESTIVGTASSLIRGLFG